MLAFCYTENLIQLYAQLSATQFFYPSNIHPLFNDDLASIIASHKEIFHRPFLAGVNSHQVALLICCDTDIHHKY